MRINSINTLSNTNFQATYEGDYKVKVADKNGNFRNKTVTAVKLDPNSFADGMALDEVENSWLYKDCLVECINSDFDDLFRHGSRHNYYAITTQKDSFNKLNPDYIIGLIEYTHDMHKKYDYINYVQVKPQLMAKNNARKIKNIGTALLEIIKNQKTGFKNIYLNALQDASEFYQKNGFKLVEKTEEPLMLFERIIKLKK